VRDVLAQDHNTEGLPHYRRSQTQTQGGAPAPHTNVTLLQGLLSVTSVVFSPDGTRIVSGSFDWTVRVWDGQENSFTDP